MVSDFGKDEDFLFLMKYFILIRYLTVHLCVKYQSSSSRNIKLQSTVAYIVQMTTEGIWRFPKIGWQQVLTVSKSELSEEAQIM